MAKICTINTSQASAIDTYKTFELQECDHLYEGYSHYIGILKVFKEIFDMVDIDQILGTDKNHSYQ